MLIGPPRCDSHVTGQQRVSNRFIFRSGRWRRWRPISDTKLDSLVSFLAEEASRLPSFLPSFVERKRKRRKNATSYPPFPFPFLFLLSFHAPRGKILFSLLSFFFLSFKRVVSTRDSVHDEIDCRFVPSSSKIRRGERKWRGKRYRGQDSPSLWSGEFGNRREG